MTPDFESRDQTSVAPRPILDGAPPAHVHAKVA
jgi:hypothetical protein